MRIRRLPNGFVPIGTKPQRIAQSYIMCIRLRIVVLLFGAKPRDPSERLTCLSHSSTLAVDGHRLVLRAPLPGGTAVQVSCVPSTEAPRHRTARNRYHPPAPSNTPVKPAQLHP